MNVDRTGALSDDDILLHNVFASEALVEVALATVGKAAPSPRFRPSEPNRGWKCDSRSISDCQGFRPVAPN
jgi:hypothetical protein